MAKNCDLYDEALKLGSSCFMVDDDDGEYPTTRSYEGSSTFINEYAGFQPPQGVTVISERVAVSEITPELFFANYVSHRKPVAIAGHLKDHEWAGNRWTNAYLRAKAGKAKVLVEKRPESAGAAGLGAFGPKSDMEYGKFLTEIELGHEGYYMTTQDLERDESDLDEYGMPQSVLAEPLRSLIGEFPLRPSLLGNLIPYQLSLWQGSSRAGASSGLHHDYHDNLYVLLRGRKRFRLFPPSAAKYLRTTGTITKIHINGLIVYEFKQGVRTVNVRSDSVPLAFLARRKREDAEAEIVDAEDDLLCLHDDAGKARRGVAAEEVRRLQEVIANCEERIDEAMRETIRYGDVSDDEDDEVISIKDSDDDEASEPVAKQARLDLSAEEPASDSHKIKSLSAAPKLETNFCNIALPRGDAIEELEAFLVELRNAVAPTQTEKMDTSEATNASEPHTIDSEKSSTLVDASAKKAASVSEAVGSTKLDESLSSVPLGCLVVHLEPGEMLYIPASWFHEVTSFDEEPIESIDDEAVKCNDSSLVNNVEDKAIDSGVQVDASAKCVEVSSEVNAAEEVDKTGEAKEGETTVKAVAEIACETKTDDAKESNADDASAKNSAATESVPEEIAKDAKTSEPNSLPEADAKTSEVDSGVTDSSSESASVKTSAVVEIAAPVPENSKTQSDVENSNLPTSKTLSSKSAEPNRGHLAFNYWSFPPDSKNFLSPYAGEFWPRRWKEIELLRRTMGVGAGRPQPPPRVNNVDTNIITLDSDSQDDEDDDDEEDEEEYSSDCYTMEEGSSLIYEGSSMRSPKQRGQQLSRMTQNSRSVVQGAQHSGSAAVHHSAAAMHHGATAVHHGSAAMHQRNLQQRPQQQFQRTLNVDRTVANVDLSNFCEIIDEDSSMSEGEEVGSTNAGTDKNHSRGDTVENSETENLKENSKVDATEKEIRKDAVEETAAEAINGNGDTNKAASIELSASNQTSEVVDGDEKKPEERHETNEESSNGIEEKMETNGAEAADVNGKALSHAKDIVINRLSSDDVNQVDAVTRVQEKEEPTKVVLDASNSETVSDEILLLDKEKSLQKVGQQEVNDVEKDLDNILDEGGDDDGGLDDAIDDGLLDDNSAAV